jgi:hypothetical protein
LDPTTVQRRRNGRVAETSAKKDESTLERGQGEIWDGWN